MILIALMLTDVNLNDLPFTDKVEAARINRDLLRYSGMGNLAWFATTLIRTYILL